MQTLCWRGDSDGYLTLIDQTRLPRELCTIECRDVEAVVGAIRNLRVRGAPAIGIAAAYGLCVGLQPAAKERDIHWRKRLEDAAASLSASRPTAMNLFWALDRMQRAALTLPAHSTAAEALERLLVEARRIHDEDRAICHAIGQAGAPLLADGQSVLTHCNAGGLAASEYGTALSVVFTAHDQGKHLHVFVDETRPLLQGARLTAWELVERGIPCTLICDSMAAQVLREGRIHAVLVGADRIAANGDTANKIGTYGLALLAAAHDVPFYVAAPTSTFDTTLTSGDEIPIEQRPAHEVTHPAGQPTAPEGVQVYNPAFDVTPARYIHALITERGILRPVTSDAIRAMLDSLA